MNDLPSLPYGLSVHGFLDLPAIKDYNIAGKLRSIKILRWFTLFTHAVQSVQNGLTVEKKLPVEIYKLTVLTLRPRGPG